MIVFDCSAGVGIEVAPVFKVSTLELSPSPSPSTSVGREEEALCFLQGVWQGRTDVRTTYHNQGKGKVRSSRGSAHEYDGRSLTISERERERVEEKDKGKEGDRRTSVEDGGGMRVALLNLSLSWGWSQT